MTISPFAHFESQVYNTFFPIINPKSLFFRFKDLRLFDGKDISILGGNMRTLELFVLSVVYGQSAAFLTDFLLRVYAEVDDGMKRNAVDRLTASYRSPNEDTRSQESGAS
jgi:hypothetical protein